MTMRRVLMIGAFAALALAACGGDDDDGGSSSSGNGGNGDTPTTEDTDVASGGDVDACELLTTAEVATAVGNPVEDGRPDVGNSCSWDSDDGFYAGVLLLAGPTRQQCVSALEGDDTYTEASEFGDGAFTTYNPNVGGSAGVVICTDSGQLSVTVSGLEDPPDEQHLRSAAAELAPTALDRL